MIAVALMIEGVGFHFAAAGELFGGSEGGQSFADARKRMRRPRWSRLFVARMPVAVVISLRVISSTTLSLITPLVFGPRAKAGARDFWTNLFPTIRVVIVALPVFTQYSESGPAANRLFFSTIL